MFFFVFFLGGGGKVKILLYPSLVLLRKNWGQPVYRTREASPEINSVLERPLGIVKLYFSRGILSTAMRVLNLLDLTLVSVPSCLGSVKAKMARFVT